MDKEKNIKRLEAFNNASILLIITGIVIGILARTVTVLEIAVLLIIAGGAGCIISEYALKKMTYVTLKDLRQKIDQWDDEQKTPPNMYQSEYSFIQYLQENSFSLEELIEYLDNESNPRYIFEIIYQNYKEEAEKGKIQSKKQVLSMIRREKMKRSFFR